MRTSLGLIVLLSSACLVLARTSTRSEKEERSPKEVNPAALGFQNLPWNFTAPSANLPVTGEIPKWLKGTLYRNGPVRWPQPTSHWFIGLGMIHAFRFEDGVVSYNNQFIRSGAYNQSMPHGFAGPLDGFVADDPLISQRHPRQQRGPPPQHESINTDVTVRRVQTHLLSNSGGLDSNEFHPTTLDTVAAPFIYDDNLTFSGAPSHAQTDPAGNVFHLFYLYEPTPGYQLYYIPAGERTRKVLGEPIRAPTNVTQPFWLHSFALTENYVVICEVPAVLSDFTFEKSKFLAEFGTRWHVVSRTTGKYEASFKTSKAFFMYHVANAYEETVTGGTNIIVDLVYYPNLDSLSTLSLDKIKNEPENLVDEFTKGGLYRYHLPLSNPGAEVSGAQIGPSMEFPTIYYEKYCTKKHRYVYGSGVKKGESTFFDSLLKIDTETGETKYHKEDNTFPGEPIFVPSPDSTSEDDGIILSVVLDATKKHSSLLILNAKTFEKIATADVSYAIPFGFHGKYY